MHLIYVHRISTEGWFLCFTWQGLGRRDRPTVASWGTPDAWGETSWYSKGGAPVRSRSAGVHITPIYSSFTLVFVGDIDLYI